MTRLDTDTASVPGTSGDVRNCHQGSLRLTFRCNEQLELTVTHTVWMREHNRVAGRLQVSSSTDDSFLALTPFVFIRH